VNDPLVARTHLGPVRGFAGEGVNIWRGIRYAAPAEGALRWRPAQPASPWHDVRDATAYGTRSMQERPAGLPPFPDGDGDAPEGEDCLFLNVCGPAAPSPEPAGYPVLVWLHGGGFHFGSGADMIGDGDGIAREGVVVVSVNYRLGALGFLYLEDVLGAEYADAENCGLSDQIFALDWVRRNVAAFGGDPARVTVTGVSAGAKSLMNVLASPLARGLYHGAISDSGGDHTATREQAIAVRSRLTAALGVSVEELPDVPAADIQAAQKQVAPGMSTWVWRAMTGTRFLPERPTVAVAAGSAAGVPLLAGTARDEAGVYDDGDPRASDQADAVLTEIFGADGAEEVLAAYASNRPDATPRQVRRAVMGDERYGIPTIRLLEAQAVHAPVWRWRFDGPVPGRDGIPRAGYHGDATGAFWRDTTPGGSALRDEWLTLIKTGRASAAWPEYAQDRSTFVVRSADDAVTGGVAAGIVADPDGVERRCWDAAEWQPGSWWADAP